MCLHGQEPRHLQYVADMEGLNVYSVVNSRKLYSAPTDFTFCIKVPLRTSRGESGRFYRHNVEDGGSRSIQEVTTRKHP